MKLIDFLSEQGISQADFAGSIGVSPATVSRYITGDRAPSSIRVRKIKEVTNGRVTADDLLCGEPAE